MNAPLPTSMPRMTNGSETTRANPIPPDVPPIIHKGIEMKSATMMPTSMSSPPETPDKTRQPVRFSFGGAGGVSGVRECGLGM
jgi:hypothetical protein